MNTFPEVDEFTLERKEFIISHMIHKVLLADNAYLEKLLEEDMYMLTICHRPFVKVLQENKPIVSVPNSNWDWFKSLFNFKHKRKVYNMNEYVSFPNYNFPKVLGEARVYTNTDFYIQDTKKVEK